MDDQGGVAGSELPSVNIQTSTQALTVLMADRLGAPMGLTTVIDELRDRQVFVAAIGLPEPVASLRETPLSRSFCRIVKATNAPLAVTDARQDARVRDNPVIDELGVMAYLGYPLRSSGGEPLGSVCVLDTSPRDWTAEDHAQVRAIAEAINLTMSLQAALLSTEEERRQTEAANRALAESNRQLIDLATNMPGAIVRYVESPDGTSETEMVSPGCWDIWELTGEDVRIDARLMWDMILPEDLPAVLASVRRCAEVESPWNHRWRIRTPSGKLKWLEGYGQPRRTDDGKVIWNSLVLDVTRAVLAEQQAAETMRLLFEAGKQETIGRLAGGIAHDFNNLLMVVRGNAEALIDPAITVDRETLGRSIIKAAELGSELTRRLVSFARQSDLHPSVVDVNREITGLHDVLRSALPAGIRLHVTLAEDLPPVFVDRSFLESSLLNLVLNARDAIHGTGAITIETTTIELTEAALQESGESMLPGLYVRVTVADSGEGMTPEVLARIFEPFFTTKSATKGTGLGLPMVEGFVRQSGGMIRVISEPGKGTSFCLCFPVLEGEIDDDTAPLWLEEPVAGPATVLLVEDQDEVRSALRRMLASDGYTVIEAVSGDAGLETFLRDQDRIDVVVSDVAMPGRLQGPDMVAQIRSHCSDVPAIFVSGYPHEASIHSKNIRRDDMMLTKPVSRDVIRAAIARALRQGGGVRRVT